MILFSAIVILLTIIIGVLLFGSAVVGGVLMTLLGDVFVCGCIFYVIIKIRQGFKEERRLKNNG